MTTKSRTISYLRAVWSEQVEVKITLQQTLEHCLTNLPRMEDTQIDLREGRAEIRHRRLNDNLCKLHIAAWTDREEVSTVPHETNVANYDLSSQAPGKNYDFLDGDGMMLIFKNHCFLMSSGLHPKSMEQYVRNLFRHSRSSDKQVSEEADSFNLIQFENPAVIKEIIDQGGIKKVNLNVGRYMETARESSDFHPRTIIERLGANILDSLALKDETRRQIEEAENVHAQLVISIDGRRSGLEHETFDSIVQKVAEESLDDVVIETKAGKRIKNSELVLKKIVNIEAFGKTVHHNSAWEEMEKFFNELRVSGMLEE